MPKSAQTRSNKYFLDRLRREQPTIFADFKAGKFKNATEAFEVAGLRKKRSALDALRSAWKKATTVEKAAFRLDIGCASVVVPSSAPVVPGRVRAGSVTKKRAAVSSTSTIHADGYLTPDAVKRMKGAMARRKIGTGTVMREIGHNALNPSLGMAINQGLRIHDPATLKELAKWLAHNFVEE